MYETLESLPLASTRSFRPDWQGKPLREITTAWVLNPGEEGVPQVRVTLTSYHWPDRKSFLSRLSWETVEKVERHPSDGPGATSITSWGSDHKSVGISSIRVDRYSKKALEEFHTNSLETFAVSYEESNLPEVFRQAAERNGLGVEVDA